jgi:DNA-binding CsgD family transcriptional regulator
VPTGDERLAKWSFRSFSRAEIRAAQGLLAGNSIDDLATDLGLSRETIRSQVKAVLAKTGTSRQADLIALLSNVKSPAWDAKTFTRFHPLG